MTETELTDRLRETIVLDGPDAWQRTSYLQDAQAAGIPLASALKRAAEISQEVANNSLLYDNIRARIARLAQPSRSHLIEQDLHQILNAATSLNLSPDFVRNRWVPTVLQQQTLVSAPAKSVSEEKPAPAEPVTPEPEPVIPDPEPTPVPEPEPIRQPEPPASKPAPETVVSITQPAPVYRSEITRPPENPPVVRSFTASPARVYSGQTVTLSWDVANLLAVTIDDLGEGLSPQNRGWVKPSKTTDYTLFDANNTPLSTVRVEVIKRDRSGIYGVLFAVVLLALIYWFIKNTNSSQPTEPERKSRTAQPERSEARSRWNKLPPASTAARSTPPETSGDDDSSTETSSSPAPVVDEPGSSEPTESATPARTASKPVPSLADARQGKYEETFGNKPYDKVELGADEQGWRRARVNGRWGYVDADDEWVIEPEYEAVTPFRGNMAQVFQDGKLITINRSGEQVRNP
ncbi:WG repeat-containing protein [Spirosoma sp. KUDC1026]|uniref:WG repeat-containing protein n=1 Tax=Spirosoma sp. KUDC1026 TaxID=2745947 RepID=UPI00159BC945|nr:WG repeat-containing protein [Spirosoma sp. KUDC1026]QKZ15140.1 WG repeat-containing protein [Spirosoma sp. KUDC1026]